MAENPQNGVDQRADGEPLPEPPKKPPSLEGRERRHLQIVKDYGSNLLWILGKWVKAEDMFVITHGNLQTEFRFLQLSEEGGKHPQWHWRTKGETRWERLDSIYIIDKIDPATSQNRANMNAVAHMLHTLDQQDTTDEKMTLINAIARQSKIKREGIDMLTAIQGRQWIYRENGNLIFRIWAQSDNTWKDVIAKVTDFGFIDGQWMWREVGGTWAPLDQKYIVDFAHMTMHQKDLNSLNGIADSLMAINTRNTPKNDSGVTHMTANLEIPANLITKGNLMGKILGVPTKDGKTQKIKLETYTFTDDEDGKQKSRMCLVDVDRNKRYKIRYPLMGTIYATEKVEGERLESEKQNFDAISLHFKVDIAEILEKSGAGYASFIGDFAGPSSVVAILDTDAIQQIATALGTINEESVLTQSFTLRFDTQRTDASAIWQLKRQAAKRGITLKTEGAFLIAPHTQFKICPIE